jgi:hypothetical protein
VDTDRNLAVYAQEVSEEGMRLILRRALPPDTEVEVVLSAPELAEPLRRLARIAWCKPLTAGVAWAGMHFDPPIPLAYLDALSNPSAACR